MLRHFLPSSLALAGIFVAGIKMLILLHSRHPESNCDAMTAELIVRAPREGRCVTLLRKR